MLERSYECNKKRVKIYFGVVWRSMCDDVSSQPSIFQFDAKNQMDELSFFPGQLVHAIHGARPGPA